MEPRELLRRLMDIEGLNPNSLAAKTNGRTKQPQIHRFLSGTVGEPKRSTWQPVANFFGISVEAFFDHAIADKEWAEYQVRRPFFSVRGSRPVQSGGDQPFTGSSTQTMAQDLSHDDDETPLIEWELLMSVQLPDVFRMKLRDDALAPKLYAGDELVFKKAAEGEAKAGQLVLLRDHSGNHIARVLRERLPGELVAWAPNDAYSPLDVGGLNLQVIGICIQQRINRSWEHT